MKTVINFRVEETQKEQLEAVAKLTQSKLSNIVRDLIDEYLIKFSFDDKNQVMTEKERTDSTLDTERNEFTVYID